MARRLSSAAQAFLQRLQEKVGLDAPQANVEIAEATGVEDLAPASDAPR